ncbi:uncharacterized protein MKZ38_005008 [Zalerion maritima]|uniref:Uncharacterized protein n=1 Tax=Zalerion maritima TaxID=339359 RepID=A0AAD5WP82_9PEZI|nr:uncharacterized protein MKZ38_005008 [Zalerion maritima]
MLFLRPGLRCRFQPAKLSQTFGQTPARLFSTSTRRHGQLSIFVNNLHRPHHGLQQSALDEVELYAERFKHHRHIGSDHSYLSVLFDQMIPPEHSDGVLVVASSELVSWIDDAQFIPNLLRALFHSSPSWGEPPPDKINVVAAVTAGISPKAPGISILHGNTNTILPDFGRHSLPHSNDSDGKLASLSFSMPPLGDSAEQTSAAGGEIEVTQPLANTIFDNGMQSTLRASTWARDQAGTYGLIEEFPLSTQRVVPDSTTKQSTTSGSVPLMAVCPPRKVTSGLGNIIRQIEIDGENVPASKELEKNIDKLLTNSPDPGPVSIWACMIPEDKLSSGGCSFMDIFQKEKLDSFYEDIQGQQMAQVPVKMLVDGCQIFQVLSGGGGWGAKQGLLSLDSETSYSIGDTDEDLEMFVKSFTSFNISGAATGMVTPGDYVQFFINFPSTPAKPSPGTFLGVGGSSLDSPVSTEGEHAISMLVGHFGTLSSKGMFLGGSKSQTGMEAKINTDGACLQGRWPKE